MRRRSENIFYVYVLFDQFGIPRYVGKGKGRRINDHGKKREAVGPLRGAFIRQTMSALGEIPRVKVRDHLTEDEALSTERAFIAAIGRYPDGPLVNRTSGGNGLSGYIPTSETRRLMSKNSRAWNAALPPDQRVARAKNAALTLPPEIRSSSAKERWAKRTADERAAIIRKGHQSRTAEQRSQSAKDRWASRSPEQRSLIGRKAAAKVSKELRVENGRKGMVNFKKMTAEERSARSHKAWVTRKSRLSPVQSDPTLDQN